MLVRLFVFLSAWVSVLAKNELYMGYKIYNIKLHTSVQEDKFHILKSDMIDFLRKPSLKHDISGLAMVPPSHAEWFEEKLQDIDIKKDIIIDDVYKYLQEKHEDDYQINDDKEFDLNNYYRYDKIITHLKAIEEKYADSNDISVQLVEAGATDEERALVYLKLTSHTSLIESKKPVIVVESGIIPREWITIPSAVNIIDKLLEDNHKRYLENVDWIFIPVLNPDGYEYTHTNLRLWSKSRSMRSNLGHICPGVNINRNFDIDWSVSDSSSSPCSHLYSGVEAFSEPETRLIKKIIEENGDSIKLYISLQNNGNFISYPWQYERAASGMFRQHHLLGLDMISSLEDYKLDVGSLTLGDRASGTSTDYAMDSGILYTFNVNIGNRGTDGVVIPEEEIKPIAEKVWNIVSVAANSIISANS